MPRKRPEGRLDTETARQIRALDLAITDNPRLTSEATQALMKLRADLMKTADQEARGGGSKAKG
jgi:hypothetical protein